jgi:hypothetical protein
MPSKSQEQHDFMQAAAHNKEFADNADIPQEVAKEFVEADKEAGLWQKSEEKKPE